MQIQFTVYDDSDIVFVESFSYSNKIPRVGETIHFPDSDDQGFASVVDVIYHLYLDGDPFVEVICDVCLEPKCRDKKKT